MPRQILQNIGNIKFHKSPSSENCVSLCGRTDGQTDRQTDRQTDMTPLVFAIGFAMVSKNEFPQQNFVFFVEVIFFFFWQAL